MDKDLPHHDHNNTSNYSPPAPPPIKKIVSAAAAAGGVGGGDRLKRDEWSEGAVSSLLEAYEAKWILRNRAKLKGQDWEDVAKHVSSRANSGKSPKTQTQCKNKIESMKKRYRSESVAVDGSSWPLYPRLDHLLRGSTAPILLRQPPQLVVELPPPAIIIPSATQPTTAIALDLHGSNGIDKTGPKEEGVVVGTNYESSDKNPVAAVDTDSSTPALYSNGDKGITETETRVETERRRNQRRRRSSEEEEEGEDEKGEGGGGGGGRRNGKRKWEVAKSIRWLAEAVVRAEESRTEAMREVERMRSEAETKRAEMELKRTEIIANTQLEIARIFAAAAGKGNIDSSSFRMGRS